VITGYNTDVKHDGKVFHVQTEDKGALNPIIETLVYVGGGQIIASKQYHYDNLVANGKCDDRAVLELLESQHRRMMRWVSGGKYDPNGPPPFGFTIVSSRSFDEVVLEFIKSQEGSDPIEIHVEEFAALPGRTSPFKILIRTQTTYAAAPGSQVTITLCPAAGKPLKLLAAAAGADGRIAGNIDLPDGSAGGILLIEARQGGQTASAEVAVEAASP
jgi:hypothetical protein